MKKLFSAKIGPPGQVIFLAMVPLIIGFLVILKVFFLKGCFAFDMNDDVNHTFVNLFAARSILASGQMPLMNLFNNFGTPLIGDAITYPFAVQAVTYFFLPPYLAMTLNRFLIAIATIVSLNFYFRRHLSVFSAGMCALLAFGTSGFLWHFAHHHYQMSLLVFSLLLIFQERFAKSGAWRDGLMIYLSMILALLSVNIQVVFIMIAFLFVNQLLLSEPQPRKRSFIFGLIVVSSLIFIFPEIWSLARAVAASGRVNEGYGFTFTNRKLMLDLIGQTDPWRWHLDPVIYFSIPILAMAGFSLVHLFQNRATRPLAWKMGLLGIAPIFVVLALLRFQSWWWAIPFVKSTDISRIWWISNLFMLVGVGKGLDSLRNRECSWKSMAIFSLVVLAAVLYFQFIFQWKEIIFWYKLPVFIFSAGLILCAAALFYFQAGRAQGSRQIFTVVCSVFLVLSLIGSQAPSFIRILGLHDWLTCRTSHHFSPFGTAQFQPQQFLKFMRPYSRMASALHSVRGSDLKVIEGHIFGSNARSVFVNGPFAHYLEREGVVTIDSSPMAYYFSRPWNKKKISRFGIRYLLQFGPIGSYEQEGWKLLTDNSVLFLYENPDPVGIVYFTENGTIDPIAEEKLHFKGNGMTMDIPPLTKEKELTVTFLNLPGWIARADGKEKKILAREDHLIHIMARPGEKILSLQYEPYRWYHFAGAVFLSILLFVGTFFFNRNSLI